MNAEQVLSVTVAACCLFALGASASTLQSSVHTTPDDVIDFRAGTLPLPSDQVANLKRQVQSDGTGGETSGGAGGPPRGDPPEGQTRPRSKPGGSSPGAANDRSGDRPGMTTERGHRPGSVPAEPTLLQRLLALLRRLLELLLSVLPYLVVGGIVVASVRFRDRLRSALDRFRGRLAPTAGDRAASAGDPVATPSNDVEAAWYEMVRRAGLAGDATRTPRECANGAVAAGVEPDLAHSLTATFEQVRYGGAPVTDQRRTRARHSIQQIRTQLSGSGGGSP